MGRKAETADEKALLREAWEGNKKEVESLVIEKKVAIDVGDTKGHTALHLAAGKGEWDVVEFLIEKFLGKGDKLDDIKDKKGFTALHYAAEFGHDRVVEILLAKGMSHGAKSFDGTTPLRLAVKSGDFDVVKLLSKKAEAAELIEINSENGETLLHEAARNGRLKIAEFLIKQIKEEDAVFKGTSFYEYFLNLANDKEETSLDLAAKKGKLEIAKFLLDQGADFTVGSQPKSPEYYAVCLICAAESGNFKMINEILGLDAVKKLSQEDREKIFNYVNDRKETPLLVAARHFSEEKGGEKEKQKWVDIINLFIKDTGDVKKNEENFYKEKYALFSLLYGKSKINTWKKQDDFSQIYNGLLKFVSQKGSAELIKYVDDVIPSAAKGGRKAEELKQSKKKREDDYLAQLNSIFSQKEPTETNFWDKFYTPLEKDPYLNYFFNNKYITGGENIENILLKKSYGSSYTVLEEYVAKQNGYYNYQAAKDDSKDLSFLVMSLVRRGRITQEVVEKLGTNIQLYSFGKKESELPTTIGTIVESLKNIKPRLLSEQKKFENMQDEMNRVAEGGIDRYLIEGMNRNNQIISDIKEIASSIMEPTSKERIDPNWENNKEAYSAMFKKSDEQRLAILEHQNKVGIRQKANKVAFIKESIVVHITDTHGDLQSSLRLLEGCFDESGKLLPGVVIVNHGDLMDRGTKSIENLLFWLKLCALYPKQVVLVPGNHEQKNTWQDYGKEDKELRITKEAAWRAPFTGENELNRLDEALEGVFSKFAAFAVVQLGDKEEYELNSHGAPKYFKEKPTLAEVLGLDVDPDAVEIVPCFENSPDFKELISKGVLPNKFCLIKRGTTGEVVQYITKERKNGKWEGSRQWKTLQGISYPDFSGAKDFEEANKDWLLNVARVEIAKKEPSSFGFVQNNSYWNEVTGINTELKEGSPNVDRGAGYIVGDKTEKFLRALGFIRVVYGHSHLVEDPKALESAVAAFWRYLYSAEIPNSPTKGTLYMEKGGAIGLTTLDGKYKSFIYGASGEYGYDNFKKIIREQSLLFQEKLQEKHKPPLKKHKKVRSNGGYQNKKRQRL